LVRALQRVLRISPTAYVNDRVDEYRAYWQAGARNLTAEFVPRTELVWEIRTDGRRARIFNDIVPIDDVATIELCADKPYVYRVAASLGVPVPEHAVFPRAGAVDAARWVHERGGVFAIKPASDTGSGLGVSTHVRTAAELLNGFALAAMYSPRIIVERMIFAESCRLLFLGGEMIHAVRRRGVRVQGNGLSTVQQLLIAQHSRWLSADATTRLTLAQQGIELDDIPPTGRRLVVRSIPASQRNRTELRTVYDEAITEKVNPQLIDDLGRTVRAVGSRLTGIDILTNDVTVPLRQSGGVLLEANPTPGVHHHYVNDEQIQSNGVATRVLAYLLEHAQ